MKNKKLCIMIIFFSCLIIIGNFINSYAYTEGNCSIDIPKDFKQTTDKISGTIFKKGNEKDLSIVSIDQVKTIGEYLKGAIKVEVVEINGYKSFFSQAVDNQGIYNGVYVIYTDNYMTSIVIHSKKDIATDEEIKKIVSSIEIKDTTTRDKSRIRKVQSRKNSYKNEVMAIFISNGNTTNKYYNNCF